MEVIEDGRPRQPKDDDEIGEAFSAGASVRVLAVQRAWPFLRGFCRDLQMEFGFRFSANLYVTPEGRQGLDTHADSHDVFVVQMAGEKDWQIFGSPYPLPVEHRAPLVFEDFQRRDHRGDPFGGRSHKDGSAGEVSIAATLRPRDLLYLPRGFAHHAVTSRGTSVHVTIGCHATTWGDLLALLAAQVSRSEERLRETLPPGALRLNPGREYWERELQERSKTFFDQLNGDALSMEVAARFGAATSTAFGLSEVSTAETPVAETPGARSYVLAPLVHVDIRDDVIELRGLRSPATVTRLPIPFKPLVSSLLRGERLSPAHAPGLTKASGEVLTARLVAAGLLVAVAD